MNKIKLRRIIFCLISLIALVLIYGCDTSINSTIIPVMFESDGNIKKVYVNKGDKIYEPVQPEKEGYEFVGWVNNKDEKYNFDERVLEELTLTSKFSKKI